MALRSTDNCLNFDVHQILVGQVDSARQPANVPANWHNLQFVYATCSVTLVEEKGEGGSQGTSDSMRGRMKLLVDCASAYEREKLEQVLRAKGVDPRDISHLVLTHWHSDHCGNLGLFPNAQLITPEGIRSERAEVINANLPRGISVHLYGGHSSGDVVVRVQQLKKHNGGKTLPWNVVIAGDIFEFKNDWEAAEPWKHSSLMPDRQIISRFLCWKGADEIIPGHGPSFQVTTTFPHQTPLFGRILFESESPNSSQFIPGEKYKGYASVKMLLCFDVNDPKGHNQRFNIYLVRGRDNTIVLIHVQGGGQSTPMIVLVNTGGSAQRQQLIGALAGEEIAPDQVTHVVITNLGVPFCFNIDLFKNAKTFMFNDIALPGCYYASIEQYFVNINREIIVWRDLDPTRDSGALSVLIKREQEHGQMVQKRFTLIGSKWDAFIFAYMDLTDEDIELAPVIQSIPNPEEVIEEHLVVIKTGKVF